MNCPPILVSVFIRPLQTLLVPVRDGSKITSLQFIDAEGDKKFKSGGRIDGCYFAIGNTPGDTPFDKLLVCEGFATGASLYHATGYPVAVAFNAGNLVAVAKALRKRLPDISLVLCADNDRFKDTGNTGVIGATKAAQAVSGLLAVPQFQSDDGEPTDFNDLHQLEGTAVVKVAIDNALAPGTDAEDAVTASPVAQVDVNFDEVVARLATMRPIEYDRVRTIEAKLLGVRPATLDGVVKAARQQENEINDSPFAEMDPWPDIINPAELLNDLTTTIQRFIVCTPETAHASALWIAFTWFIDVVQVAPLAVITAPEKRCGKSQLLFLMMKTTRRPLPASNITPAALFRCIDKWEPTLLIDEADAFMRENEELRGLINSGHTRDSAFCIRTVGDDHEPTSFITWGAKALAGIGHLADTLMDRAITLELRRKLPSESVDKLRHAEPELFSTLRQKLARFADDYAETIRAARPDLPSALNDRAADNWEPLLAIADTAGKQWSSLARKAALKLSGEDEQPQSHGAELLADIQQVFELNKLTRMFTADLVEALCEDTEMSWSTYNRGKPMTPKQLSRKLNSYGVSSKQLRIDYGNKKGYELNQFSDVFARYLTSNSTDCNDSEIDTNLDRYDSKTRRTNVHAACNDVSIKTPVLEVPSDARFNAGESEVEL